MKRTSILRSGRHHVVRLEDRAAGTEAYVHATYGFNAYSFRVPIDGRVYDVLYADDHFAEQPSRASGNGTPLLFPFPNRIANGTFRWLDRRYWVKRNERGVNAIHGFVLDRPWSIRIFPDDARVTGAFRLSVNGAERRPEWPDDFLLQCDIRLSGQTLSFRLVATNLGSIPIPWGFGMHPYFRLPLQVPGDEARCLVHVPAKAIWELEQFIPTGRILPVPEEVDLRKPRPLANLRLDHVYTELERDENGNVVAWVSDETIGYRLELHCTARFREIVVYTPPQRGAISIEPYTCTTNAVNLASEGIDCGLGVLAPGEKVEIGEVRFTVRRL